MSYQMEHITWEEVQKSTYPAHIHLHLSQAEALTGDGTNWYSPGTYVTLISSPVNFSYTGGSIVYTGEEDIEVLLLSTVSMSSTLANVDVEMTGGTNGVPNEDYIVTHVLTNANDVKELSMNIPVQMSKNDTLDFYVRASQNISLEKAVWLAKNNE